MNGRGPTTPTVHNTDIRNGGHCTRHIVSSFRLLGTGPRMPYVAVPGMPAAFVWVCANVKVTLLFHVMPAELPASPAAPLHHTCTGAALRSATVAWLLASMLA